MKTTIAQIIEGNLTADHTYFPGNGSKRSMIEVTIASSTRRRNTSGEWENGTTDYITVKLFGNTADVLEQAWNNGTLGKGVPVIAYGKFDPHPRAWIGRDGEAHSEIQFNADTLTTNLIVQQIRSTTTTVPEQPEASWAGDGFQDVDMPF